MTYVAVIFEKISAEQAQILIALLSNCGFEGFEEADTLLKAFIAEEKFNEQELIDIITPFKISYSLLFIEHQNWNAQWESSFKPVKIKDFAAVRATFHEPVNDVKHEIIITPKMSFGTGHHATTFLMMEQMSEYDFSNKKVLDFGTGTGILAILAAKMGAMAVTAIDNDDWSIINAVENIKHNLCETIVVNKADFLLLDNKYDIILANINLSVILKNMPAIAANCKIGTIVILSGFLKGDESKIKTSLLHNQLIFNSMVEKNGWLSVTAIFM
jgi:ribosomal protein L11 methyltransferase